MPALELALDALLERHEALRTRVVQTPGGLVQVVEPAPSVRLDVEALDGATENFAAHASAVLTQEAREPFDIARSPLARFRLFERGATDHVLTYTVHHLASDGWSVELFLRELASGYKRAREGAQPAAGPPAARYADFVAWERALECSERGRSQLAYWARQLDGAPSALALPTDRPRPRRSEGNGASLAFELGETATAGTRRLARQHRTTPQAVVLAAFAGLLSIYSGQDDLVVGSPFARRPRREFEDVVGMFVNMAALRIDTSGNPTFGDLVARVRDVMVGAFAHQDVAFDTVVAELGLRREPGLVPLLRVAFVAPPALEIDMTAVGLRAEVIPIHTQTSKFDLTLYVADDSRTMHGQIEFSTELLDEPTVERLARHLTRVLERAIERPGLPLAELELLDDEECAEQLERWNDTDAEFPDVGLAELVRRAAAARPDAVALSEGAVQVTYGELVERAGRVARGLLACGVVAGDFVGLLLERGIGQVEAVLGVLFAGAAYVPIEPATPAERLAFIVADAGLRWMVVDREIQRSEALDGVDAVTLEELREGGRSAAALPEVSGPAPAYCIYTSGTTGHPKGVVVTHRNLARLLACEASPFEFGIDDTWCLFHSYTFDFAVWELFACLVHGGRLVVAGAAEARDTERFWALLRRERVSVLNQTPSAFAQLMALERREPDPLAHLRYVIFGGERLTPGTLADFRERHPHAQLVNMYGITEVTVHASVRFVTDADVADDVSNIGVPIPTTELHVLDRHGLGRLLPAGAVGELYVGGLGVAAGYLRRPELDAARFVANPFGPGRLFRSGDLARRRPDGTIEFLGRADTQVKLRGYRIEPGEVEAALRAHPGVADAVVRIDPGGERLVAFVVASTPAPGVAELRSHLARKLPDYMIPGAFREVERLPLTHNGKLDERALWALGVQLDDHQGGPPQTPTAEALGTIWAELLDVDQAHAGDSFFDLGGHSLLAVRALERAKELFGVELLLRDLFDNPRLQDLADLIDDRRDTDGTSNADGSPSSELLPASSFQQRIWFDERLRPDTPLYNVPLAWRVEGRLDRDELERALALVVERHEILRTRFVERDGRVHQLVEDPWPPRLAYHDLRTAPPPRRDAEVTALLREAARQPFDTSTTPLLRFALLRTGEDEHVLFVCVHHLVWDAESTAIFLRELGSCMEAVTRGPVASPRVDTAAPTRVDDSRAVSAHQERMAFFEQLESGVVYPQQPIYHNLALFLRTRTVPDVEAVARAVGAAVERHEALSTNIRFGDGGFRRVAGPRDGRIVWLAPEADAGDRPPDVLLEQVRQPLALDHDALFRAVVLPLDDGSSWLALIGHLAVVDRHSLYVVARELLDDLSGKGHEVSGTRYSDWWRRHERDRVAVTRDVARHAERLRSEVEPLALPHFTARAPLQEYQEGSVEFAIPDALRSGGLCTDLVTLPDLLLAGVAALMATYSGQEQIPIGMLRTERKRDDQGVVGPVAEPVPLVLQVPGNLTFRQLARNVAFAVGEAYEAEHAEFDELVRAVRVEHDTSRMPLFDVLFQCVDAGDYLMARSDLLNEIVETGSGYGRYDLHFFVRAVDLSGSLLYNSCLYDGMQAARLARHLSRLLHRCVATPDAPLGELDLLDDEERAQQLETWNATAAGFPDIGLAELVRRAAAERPDAVALTCGARQWTYRNLVTRAERVAQGLVRRGVVPGDFVGLLLSRGPGQVEAVLGVLFAGAAYVPIEPATPAERLAFIVADAGLRWMLVDPEIQRSEALDGVDAVTLEELREGGRSAAALPEVSGPAPAYCIYTSGTTGHPKGVVVTHRNVVRLVANDRFPFEFGPDDVWAMFHSYTFDITVWDLFGCLNHGGRLVLAGEDEARDSQRLWRLLQSERVTLLYQTPSAFAQLLRVEESEPAELDHLRYVLLGGERLEPALLAGFRQRHPWVRIANKYGITEVTVDTAVRFVTDEDVAENVSNIGGPIPTTTIHLLDPGTGRRLLPAGAVGEIYVGGLGVAAGYLRRPELDAARFLPNPFAKGRMFRSGDLARYRPDGTLEFLGRADSQIKLRGYRIEPGEIEAALREHPLVSQAVVRLDEGGERLVAYIVASTPAPTSLELRAHVGGKVPEYMVPGRFRSLERLPLTKNGKLDERALHTASVALDDHQGGPPQTPTAEALGTIWAELLDLDQVYAGDSFFDLGGHSLLAARVVARINSTFRVDLPLRELFDHHRLQDLADVIDRHSDVGVERALDDIPSRELLPASSFQQRIWFDERLRPDTPLYNVPLAWRVEGRLDCDELERALALVVERHEILRTRFVERDGRLYRLVDDPWTPRVDYRDLTAVSPDRRDDVLDANLRSAAREPFDVSAGRLLRSLVLRVDDRREVLFVCAHHLVWDGECAEIFLRDLERCRRQGSIGMGPQYDEYVNVERQALATETGSTSLSYWTTQLDGLAPHLPLAPPPVAEPNGVVRLDVSSCAAAVQRVRQQLGASWFIAAAAALAKAVHGVTASSDIGIACQVSDRGERFGEVIGPCLNTVVLRSICGPETTVGDLLEQTRATVLDAHDHRATPLDSVIARLSPPRQSGRAPFTDVVLNMAGTPASHWMGSTLQPVVLDWTWQHDTKFGLTVTLPEAHSDEIVMSYDGTRFARADIERIAEEMRSVLEGGPESLGTPVLSVAASGTADRGRSVEPAEAQYRDFVLAQAGRRSTDEGSADLAHWVAKLRDVPPFLPLSPPRRPGRNGSATVTLPPAASKRLRSLQDQEGVTLFMVLAAALAAVLHRWTGAESVTFGSAVANRDGDAFTDVLGPCSNTVVLRSDCAEGTTLGALLRDMKQAILDAVERQAVPFEDVVAALNPARRPGWTPFVDVMLALEPDCSAPSRLAGRPLTDMHFVDGRADYMGKFGLTVGFRRVGDELRGEVYYRGDRFAEPDAHRLAGLLGRVLAGYPDRLEEPLQTADLVDEAERRELARFESGGPADPPATVVELVAEASRQRPEATAVSATGVTLTYRDLDDLSASVAARLRRAVDAPDGVVVLCLERGWKLIVAMLGVWRAGFSACLIDPEYPDRRIEYIVGDVAACAIVVDGATAKHTPIASVARVLDATDELGLHPMAVDTGADGGVGTDELPAVRPSDRACVIYTSGSTGEPKGVQVSHASLAQLVRGYNAKFAPGPDDRASQLAGVGFDAVHIEVWPYLSAGACVVPYEGRVVASDLIHWLDAHAITRAFVPTPLAEAVWTLGARPARLSRMIVGGASLLQPVPDDLPYRVSNAYGPTEATVVAAIHDVEPSSWHPVNCVGRPIAGTWVTVRDAAGKRCPVGVPGEVWIGGAGVAAGYLDRAALTRERFVDLGPDDGPGRAYRTGDRGRWLDDGTLEILGRMDRQLKIRGVRIEPGEIESWLSADPLVEQCLVRGVGRQRQSLVAYLVPVPGGRRDTPAVVARLRAGLPRWMVPDAIVWLDALPLSANGKVDVDRLPVPDLTDRVDAAPRIAPRGELQEAIAGVWRDLLGCEHVGIDDNFFDLGGDSIELGVMHARVEELAEEALPIHFVFENPTIRALARALDGSSRDEQAKSEDGEEFRERAARMRAAQEAARRRSRDVHAS
uniref:Non-ribosomal peptide synthetase n=1 Tax=uncultured bacterium NM_1663 TaxID=1630017 RepID=A0A0E3M286_9BACT|nr:non-ribosomal peptide synthetase [uncultured bacterium NM_1663]